jgi:hypothetical protein
MRILEPLVGDFLIFKHIAFLFSIYTFSFAFGGEKYAFVCIKY